MKTASEARPRRELAVPDDGYVSLQTLTRYAGLSVRTLRGYLHDSVTPLPHYRVRGKILVKRSDYDAWLLRFRRCQPASLDTMVNEVLNALR